MDNRFEKWDAWFETWSKTSEGKKLLEKVNRTTLMLAEIAPKDLKKFAAEMEASIRDACKEVGALIEKEYGINPNPDSSVDFFLDEISPVYAWSGVTADDILREYAMWRRSKFYASDDMLSRYDRLCNAGYISETTPDVFIKTMRFKGLPQGEKKILWTGKKTYAMYFQDKHGFTVKQFNQCFCHSDRTPFKENNRSNKILSVSVRETLD